MLSNDNPSTRERSVRAALEVVREQGLHGLTTRAIARQSGLTQPAIYRHFASVDELIGETLGAIRSLFYERMQAAGASDGDARARLIRTLESFRDFAIDEPRLYDALFLHAGVARIDRSRGQNIFAFVVERVTECARDGSIRESGPVGSALSLIALGQGLVLLYRQGRFGSKERFAEAFSRSLEDLLRGLAAVEE